MNNPLSNGNDVWFHCGCREEWRIAPGDEKGITEKPTENVVKEHDCDKLIVYRRYKGLKRYYMKK